ncbi:hydroxyaromatic non-oxidative decarboxylase protein C [Klebsiella michiganensis]|nr:hydroxyaromatic non-oxidative decarboxylase protein C [Klebsiella michiganensis]
MAFDDLRSFLQALDDQGQLLKISEEVNAEPDLAAAANATGRIGDGAPALWFDNIRGFTDARVAMNTIGSWQNHAISLGLPPNTPVKNQIDEFIRRWDKISGDAGAAGQTRRGRKIPSTARRLICSIFCPCSVSMTATAAFISTKPAWFLAILSTRTILVSKTSAFTVWR